MDLFSVMLGKKLGGSGGGGNNNSNTVRNGYQTSFRFNNIFEVLTIPEGYSALNAATMFQGYDNLKTLYIPSTFTYFANNAFAGCGNLTKIIINKPENSIDGAPWGAPATCEVIWKG